MGSHSLARLPQPDVLATHATTTNSILQGSGELGRGIPQGLNIHDTNSNSIISMDELWRMMEYAIPLHSGENKGFSRERAYQWHEAHKEVRKPRMYADLNKVVDMAKDYRSRKSGKIALLHYSESGDPDKIVFPEQINGMLSKKYLVMLKRRFQKLGKYVEANNVPYVMLTLTTRMQEHRSILSDIELLRNAWNKLRTYLSKQMKHYNGFFAFVELGEKNQMAHMHIVVLGTIGLPENKIKQLWEKYTGAYQVKVSRAKVHTARSGGIWYAMKYVSKSIRMLGNGDLPQNLAYLWGSGKRMWSASRNVEEIMKLDTRKDDGYWEAYFISDTYDYKGAYVYDSGKGVYMPKRKYGG